MKCYILEPEKELKQGNLKKEEVSQDIEKLINQVCSGWQIRNLSQKSGGSLYANDGYESRTRYEPLNPEELIVCDGKIVGYYAHYYDIDRVVAFSGNEEKVKLGDYDWSDYSGNTNKVDRGHIAMVHRPDIDTNPYYDEPGFHSQEEYEDYIKWRD